MQPLLDRLTEARPLLADGGLGTMLFERGVTAGQCPEAVNLARPEVPEDIARAYFDAGAELIQTNTFGASPVKLVRYGLRERAVEINQAAVRIVRAVVGERAYVSGSFGPTGKLLKPYGDADPDDVYESYLIQVRALVESGVDCLSLETMSDLNEAVLAIRAARAVREDIPILATMTFSPVRDGEFFTVMGVQIEQAAAKLAEAGADVVGSNCGNGIETMVRVARKFREVTDLPLLIQANAGMPVLKGGAPHYPETPEFYADQARELVEIGVAIIGGCCGTTPAHIQALREMIDVSR